MRPSNFRGRRRLCTWLAALLLALGNGPAAWAAEADAGIVLTGRPSDWLVAPAGQWRPVLQEAEMLMTARRRVWAEMSQAERIEWLIHSAVIAQTLGRPQAVIDAVKAVRDLQTSASGRQTAGLLNELLARQALTRSDEPALRRMTRDAVLAMTWSEVESSIRSIRAALASMDDTAVKDFVKRRMDLSTSMTQGRVTLPFLMQLLGAHFQLNQVLPHRAALLTGLDDAIAQLAPATEGG